MSSHPTGEQTAPSTPTGEQTTPSTPEIQFPKVLKDNTVYYDFPAQARPPNGTAQKGWKLRILKDAGSYTQVEFENSIKGYIHADLIE